MSRLSFRPRPLDIHKKIQIVKSIKDFEDEEATTSTRNSQLLRFAAEADNEVQQTSNKKSAPEIPIPQFVVVDTYERDYSRTFTQPTSYLRGRGARAELGEFIEYDLDNEDEDWIQEFNNEKKILTPEKFEALLFKLEVLDHKARERAGIIMPTLGSPVPVLLQLDSAVEALQSHSVKYAVLQSVYNYWKTKRERWQKPILRRLQPPPPVNDTNPYNVFRPREKAHRLHTRRMQRRENNVQSFEKLRKVRRNLDQAKTVLEALVKREEKKREVMECEVNLQRNQMKYKDPLEPVFLFTRPLDPGKFAAAGIAPPTPPVDNETSKLRYRFHGRIGRGGRIVFDRWNHLLRSPSSHDNSCIPPNPRPLPHLVEK
ncbi:PREDICTED: enhancer of polycomb-like protein 1 isoform X1 [Nelumbo nucifera]|uniref:Enhancer of polycomb-like protein n=1 Tax=Nelumbo nucifera TaxID=4432 RepID=A0A1U8PZU0_NELNU|nr:PREDICTED: enhancer of polycomb-like protein 1 isoform X1 [Nelumbo nucifera]